jgi:diguanylate cyclase (GGDEF)-like protein
MPDPDSVPSFDAEAGLFSYAQIQHLLKIEFSRARRYRYPLSVCIFQIDRLESLKDLYGYKIRDQILEKVVGLVQQNSRTSDFLGRYGDRFVLILPHTDAPGVKIIMERVRDRLGETSFEIDSRPVRVTVSAGSGTYAGNNTLFFDSILKSAEEGLRRALEAGGNTILVA